MEGFSPYEFFAQSLEIQSLLVRHFPHYQPFMTWLRGSVSIEEYELTVLQHAAFVMGNDVAWMYCSEHGVVNGVESEGNKVTKINWAGAGLKGDVPSILSKLTKLRFVDLRYNAVKNASIVRSQCGMDSKSFLIDDNIER